VFAFCSCIYAYNVCVSIIFACAWVESYVLSSANHDFPPNEPYYQVLHIFSRCFVMSLAYADVERTLITCLNLNFLGGPANFIKQIEYVPIHVNTFLEPSRALLSE
jgi:hypothetical protein